ncbi:MAG: ABC transporter permease subunit [Oscillospiraceae bacterium]|jgi:NitT/TauT family transport system permease protein|nr:ABC transporter permease subunit [Oscillospiraceae bacterium]
MTLKMRFCKTAHLLFILFLAIQFLPDQISKPDAPTYAVGFAAAVEVLLLIASATAQKRTGLDLPADIAAFLYVLLIAWTLATAKFNLLKEMLFPPPGVVFQQCVEDIPQLLGHIGSSLALIAQGYLLALAAAVPLGLALGYGVRVGSAATYIAKFLGAIPPVVYIPYGIALLPSFRAVSVLVIFLASFWPILAGTMSGVLYVEQRILDSARALNVGRGTMLFRIILSAALPQIFIGCGQGLTVSFILLTSAEMIGARSGMGFYVKNYSDLGNYTRTIVGVLVIGVVISVVFFLFNKLQKFLLRWK